MDDTTTTFAVSSDFVAASTSPEEPPAEKRGNWLRKFVPQAPRAGSRNAGFQRNGELVHTATLNKLCSECNYSTSSSDASTSATVPYEVTINTGGVDGEDYEDDVSELGLFHPSEKFIYDCEYATPPHALAVALTMNAPHKNQDQMTLLTEDECNVVEALDSHTTPPHAIAVPLPNAPKKQVVVHSIQVIVVNESQSIKGLLDKFTNKLRPLFANDIFSHVGSDYSPYEHNDEDALFWELNA
jgi:hypothetical protein